MAFFRQNPIPSTAIPLPRSLGVLAGITALLIAALWSYLAFAGHTLQQEREARVRHDLVQAAQLIEVSVERQISAALMAAFQINALVGTQEDFGGQPNLRDAVRSVVDSAAPYLAVGAITNASGRMLNSLRDLSPPSALSLAERDYFKRLEQAAPGSWAIGQPVLSRIFNTPVLPVAVRRSTLDGQFNGVVVVALSTQVLSDILSIVEVGTDISASVLRADGSILLASPHAANPPDQRIDLTGSVPPPGTAIQKSGHSMRIDTRVIAGEEMLAAISPAGSLPVLVLTANPTSAITASVRDAWYPEFYTAIGFTVAILGAAVLLGLELRRRTIAEARFRALVENSPAAIMLLDDDDHIRYANSPSSQILGYGTSELLRRDLKALYHPDDLPAMRRNRQLQLAGKGITSKAIRRIRHRDGSWRSMAVSSYDASHIPGIGGRLMHYIDISDYVRERDRAAQSDRLEALGRLSGSIAHDFNNIIGAIMGFASLIEEDAQSNSTMRHYAERIMSASERAKAITYRILDFARKPKPGRITGDFGREVKEALAFIRGSIPSAIELVPRIAGDTVQADIADSEIVQIIVNLCANSRDAVVSAGRPGSIRVAFDIVSGDDAMLDLPAVTELLSSSSCGESVFGKLDDNRRYARLAVIDNGTGMPAVTLGRIFDPFFSTKERDMTKGTGIGLSTVHGILTSRGGACRVISAPGIGTAFLIYIPVMQATMEPGISEPPAPPSTSTPPTADVVAALPRPPTIVAMRVSKGNVLVVDDSPDVANSLAIALCRYGFDATAVLDPLEAADAIEADPAAWDILLTDYTMPHLNGRELMEKVRKVRADFPVVVVSGWASGADSQDLLDAGADGFISKPTRPDAVAAVITDVLQRRNAA